MGSSGDSLPQPMRSPAVSAKDLPQDVQAGNVEYQSHLGLPSVGRFGGSVLQFARTVDKPVGAAQAASAR